MLPADQKNYSLRHVENILVWTALCVLDLFVWSIVFTMLRVF